MSNSIATVARIQTHKPTLPELHLLKEGNDLLLPEDALVLLAQVGEGVAGLAVVDVRQTSLHAQAKVVTDYLQQPQQRQ